MTTQMTMIVLSAPDRDDLFAELYEGDDLWAFVERGEEGLRLRIVSRDVAPVWEFDLNAAIGILESARRRFPHTTKPVRDNRLDGPLPE